VLGQPVFADIADIQIGGPTPQQPPQNDGDQAN
jgi:hypothetical protein